MGQRLKVGLVALTLATGCGKDETSAPHTTVTMMVRGENTQNIEESDFGDGWSVQFDRFWLSPTFGVDEAPSPKDDGAERQEGAEAYVYGGGEGGSLELTSAEPAPAFYGWVLAGRSRGWGMRLRQVVAGEDLRESSLEVSGEARGPEGARVRFDWRFTTELTYAHCVPSGADTLFLPNDGDLDIEAVLDGSALFRQPGEASLTFAEMAAADSDEDGTLRPPSCAPPCCTMCSPVVSRTWLRLATSARYRSTPVRTGRTWMARATTRIERKRTPMMTASRTASTTTWTATAYSTGSTVTPTTRSPLSRSVTVRTCTRKTTTTTACATVKIRISTGTASITIATDAHTRALTRRRSTERRNERGAPVLNRCDQREALQRQAWAFASDGGSS